MFQRLKGILTALLAVGPTAVHAAPAQKATAAPGQDATRDRLAFVLLREPTMPSGKSVLAAFQRIAPKGKAPALKLAPGDSGSSAELVMFDVGDEGRLIVGLLPSPVPKQEAEGHAERSLASVDAGWKLPPHRAHLLVMWQQSAKLRPLDGVRHYTGSSLRSLTRRRQSGSTGQTRVPPIPPSTSWRWLAGATLPCSSLCGAGSASPRIETIRSG